MAASITTVSTTLEGQVFETAQKLQQLELAVPEISRPNRITINPDLEAKTVTVSITFETVISTNTNGQLVIAPVSYLA